MSKDMSNRRLKMEYIALQKQPVENIVAAPLETNVLVSRDTVMI
jgi:ubiquitin-protein ligase